MQFTAIFVMSVDASRHEPEYINIWTCPLRVICVISFHNWSINISIQLPDRPTAATATGCRGGRHDASLHEPAAAVGLGRRGAGRRSRRRHSLIGQRQEG